MRNTGICPKCTHNRVLLIDAVPDTGEHASEIRELNVAVVAAGGLLDDRLERAGKLNAVVCRACGYTELYTEDPMSIPVDGERVREVVGPAEGR